MAWRIEEMSTPARWNMPPSAPKSFCISTTTTAVRARSMVVGPGFASIVTRVFIDAISASFGRSATGLQSSGLLPENYDSRDAHARNRSAILARQVYHTLYRLFAEPQPASFLHITWRSVGSHPGKPEYFASATPIFCFSERPYPHHWVPDPKKKGGPSSFLPASLDRDPTHIDFYTVARASAWEPSCLGVPWQAPCRLPRQQSGHAMKTRAW